MARKEIEYTINPDGTVTVETFNTSGVECTSMINDAVVALNGAIISEDKKKEYYDKSPKVFTNGGI